MKQRILLQKKLLIHSSTGQREKIKAIQKSIVIFVIRLSVWEWESLNHSFAKTFLSSFDFYTLLINFCTSAHTLTHTYSTYTCINIYLGELLQANRKKIVVEPFIAGYILIETEYYQTEIATLDNYNEMVVIHSSGMRAFNGCDGQNMIIGNIDHNAAPIKRFIRCNICWTIIRWWIE